MQDISIIVKAEQEEKCEPQMNFILKCSRTAWSVEECTKKEEDLGGCESVCVCVCVCEHMIK